MFSYFWITQAFESTSGSISNLVNGINEMKSDCSDTTLLGSFMENHDNARFPSLNSDLSLAKNAIAFTILADGIPISTSMMKLPSCFTMLIVQSLLWPRAALLWW
jgi:alpha-amylase